MKLSSRLIIFILGLNAAMFTIGGALFLRFSQDVARTEFARRSQYLAESLGKDCQLLDLIQGPGQCAKNLETLRQRAEVQYIKLIENDTVTNVAGRTVEFDRSNLQGLANLQKESGVFPTFVELSHPEREMEIGISFRGLEDGLANVMRALVTWAAIQASLLSLAIFVFMRYLKRRLQPLIHACREVASGKFTAWIEDQSADEIGEVATAINRMGIMIKEAIENQERQRQSLFVRHKQASLGEMAGGMAHEINNPLAVISGSSQVLIQIAEEEGSVKKDVLVDRLRRLQAAADRIHAITRSLSVFYRDQRTMAVGPIELKPVLQRAIELTRPRARLTECQFEWEEPSPGLKVISREGDLLQVMVSVLNNAFDASREATHRLVNLKAERRNKSVVISVRDSGPGISVHLREKLMQPFFTTKEIGKGMGLGLWVSQGLLADSHGKIEFLPDLPTTVEVILQEASSESQPPVSANQKVS